MEGWIKLHRCLMEKAIFQNEKLLKVFIWCLLKASHSEHEQLIGRQKVTLQPGQFPTGRYKAAAELNMSPSTAWSYLKLLEANNTIDIKSNNKFSIVTVVNWELYQAEDKKPDSKSDNIYDNKKTTNRQQIDTNKNDKNDKNEKKKYKRVNTITSAKSASPPLADSEKLLSRYTPEQQEVIAQYWDTIRFTRKNAKIADSIKIREMEYWARYPVDIVIEALEIHIAKYQTKPEEYTRGIIRRLAREREMGGYQDGRDFKHRRGNEKNDRTGTYDAFYV